jgi:hypothetical protein
MEILGPYPNTSPRKGSVFGSCAYIQSEDLWGVYRTASREQRLGNFRSRHPG